MKRGTYFVFFILLVVALSGCGSEPETEEVKQEIDKIEGIGNGASKLGYDGDAIKKQLRRVHKANEDRNKKLDEIMDN